MRTGTALSSTFGEVNCAAVCKNMRQQSNPRGLNQSTHAQQQNVRAAYASQQ
jgi:hypothetical protein